MNNITGRVEAYRLNRIQEDYYVAIPCGSSRGRFIGGAGSGETHGDS
jgi:hypothetical protein